MEHMESKMQDYYEAMDAREAETFAMGVAEGLREAAKILQGASSSASRRSADEKDVAQSAGLVFAARVLRSYANGLAMKADAHVETQEGIRALRGARK